jgi:hypothetical protein
MPEFRESTDDQEFRTIGAKYAGCKLEMRDGQPDKITGYASVFYDPHDRGTEYELGKDRYERIMPGAFDKCILEHHDVLGLYNHDRNMVLGRTGSGTMRLSVDQRGLKYEIDPPSVTFSRDLKESLRRGDVSGSSFSFIATREEYASDGPMRVRYVRECRIFDVGPVSEPAYKSTTAVVSKRAAGNLDALAGATTDAGKPRINVGDMVQWWDEEGHSSGVGHYGDMRFGEVHVVIEDGIARLPGGNRAVPGTKEDRALIIRRFADLASGDPEMLEVLGHAFLTRESQVTKVQAEGAIKLLTPSKTVTATSDSTVQASAPVEGEHRVHDKASVAVKLKERERLLAGKA